MQDVDPGLLHQQRILWVTVLEHAIRETMATKPRVRQAALHFVFRDDVDFPTVCELAGMNGDYLRKKLASYRHVSSWRFWLGYNAGRDFPRNYNPKTKKLLCFSI